MNSSNLMWLDARETMDLSELAHVSGLGMSELAELMEYGALMPLDATPFNGRFSAECVIPLRKVARL